MTDSDSGQILGIEDIFGQPADFIGSNFAKLFDAFLDSYETFYLKLIFGESGEHRVDRILLQEESSAETVNGFFEGRIVDYSIGNIVHYIAQYIEKSANRFGLEGSENTPQSAILKIFGEGVDVVADALLLSNAVEKQARSAYAEDFVQHREGITSLVLEGKKPTADDDIHLRRPLFQKAQRGGVLYLRGCSAVFGGLCRKVNVFLRKLAKPLVIDLSSRRDHGFFRDVILFQKLDDIIAGG